jgi:hypothetical protein
LDINHVPSKAYIKKYGIEKKEGVCRNMKKEAHVQTRTYGNQDNVKSELSFRSEEAADLLDMKNIAQKEGTYNRQTRNTYREIIKQE